ncbi:MAG: glycosyltransferase [Anaerolineae bacterium]
MKHISIVLPTYNERENIVPLIERLQEITTQNGWFGECIVVDDSSPDGTAQAVASRFDDDDGVKLIVRNEERGLATAIKRGIQEAGGEVVVVMDTDFNHNPADVPELVALTKKYPVVVGSRYVPGGGMDMAAARFWGSHIFNLFIRLVLWLRTRDNLSGFLAVRREVLDTIEDMGKIFYGYGDYCIRFLYHVHRQGMAIKEVPVVYQMRGAGESKTRLLKYTLQYTASVLRLRFRGLR